MKYLNRDNIEMARLGVSSPTFCFIWRAIVGNIKTAKNMVKTKAGK